MCVKLFLKMDDPPAREGNSFTSIALFASSVCIDALTAHDVRGPSGHAPTSLRVTSVVLAACLASPPLRKWMVLEQRAVLGAALLAAAIAGSTPVPAPSGQRMRRLCHSFLVPFCTPSASVARITDTTVEL